MNLLDRMALRPMQEFVDEYGLGAGGGNAADSFIDWTAPDMQESLDLSSPVIVEPAKAALQQVPPAVPASFETYPTGWSPPAASAFQAPVVDSAALDRLFDPGEVATYGPEAVANSLYGKTLTPEAAQGVRAYVSNLYQTDPAAGATVADRILKEVRIAPVSERDIILDPVTKIPDARFDDVSPYARQKARDGAGFTATQLKSMTESQNPNTRADAMRISSENWYSKSKQLLDEDRIFRASVRDIAPKARELVSAFDQMDAAGEVPPALNDLYKKAKAFDPQAVLAAGPEAMSGVSVESLNEGLRTVQGLDRSAAALARGKTEADAATAALTSAAAIPGAQDTFGAQLKNLDTLKQRAADASLSPKDRADAYQAYASKASEVSASIVAADRQRVSAGFGHIRMKNGLGQYTDDIDGGAVALYLSVFGAIAGPVMSSMEAKKNRQFQLDLYNLQRANAQEDLRAQYELQKEYGYDPASVAAAQASAGKGGSAPVSKANINLSKAKVKVS